MTVEYVVSGEWDGVGVAYGALSGWCEVREPGVVSFTLGDVGFCKLRSGSAVAPLESLSSNISKDGGPVNGEWTRAGAELVLDLGE